MRLNLDKLSLSEKLSLSIITSALFINSDIYIFLTCILTCFSSFTEAVNRAWIINLSHKPTDFDKLAPWVVLIPSLFWLLNSLVHSFLMGTFYFDMLLSMPLITWALIILHGLNENNNFNVSERHKDGVYVGKSIIDGKTYPKPLILPIEVRRTHSITFGTTGSTKTMAVARPMIERDLKEEESFQIIVDFKGDSNFRDLVFSRCQDEGKTFRYFDITEPNLSDDWNPLAMGDAASKRDKIMTFTKWSNEHYEKIVSLYVLKIATNAGDDFNLGLLGKSIDEFDKDLSGINADIQSILLTPLGRKISHAKTSLLDGYNNNEVWFFSLPENEMPIVAKQMGDLIKLEIRNLSAYILKNIDSNNRKNVFVTVDECKYMIDEIFLGGLGQIRGAGFIVQLYSQSPKGDFDSRILDCLIDNTNIHVSLRVNSPGSTDFLSKTFGTKKATKITEQIELDDRENNTGLGSSREVNEFKVNPEDIKSFYRAESFWSIKDNGFESFVFLDDYYFSNKEIKSFKEHKQKSLANNSEGWSNDRDFLAKKFPIKKPDFDFEFFDDVTGSEIRSSKSENLALQ